MERFHILKDFQIVGSTTTEDEAIEMVRQYQARETHYMLKSEYMIIRGQLQLVSYDPRKPLQNYL
jgi:hypothetical protein